MKLLDKKQVNSQANAERKNQIDEGILLATKIDKLRMTLSSLEEQHRLFIGGIKKELEDQTSELIKTIANLELDIEELKDDKENLANLKKQWIKVKELESNLTNKQNKIDKNYEKSKAILQKVAIKERELRKLYQEEDKRLMVDSK